MNQLIVLCCVILGAVAQRPVPLAPGTHTPILDQKFDISPDGAYQFGYVSADGNSRQEVSIPKNPGTEVESRAVSGSYSYISPEGTPVNVNYEADEDGYRVTGSNVASNTIVNRGYPAVSPVAAPIATKQVVPVSTPVVTPLASAAYRPGVIPAASAVYPSTVYNRGAYPGYSGLYNGAYNSGYYNSGYYNQPGYYNGAYNGAYPYSTYPSSFRNYNYNLSPVNAYYQGGLIKNDPYYHNTPYYNRHY